MNIFLSWSGESSKAVALALQDFLRDLFPEVTSWMSSNDIQAGAQWARELDLQLEKSTFGIICLSPDNLSSPWLLFESGALSKTKSIDASRVVPYCLATPPDDLNGPLSRFQGVAADHDGTMRLARGINALLDSKRSEPLLERAFDKWWPDLKTKLCAVAIPTERGTTRVTVNHVLFASAPRFEALGAERDLATLKLHYPRVNALRNATRDELSGAFAEGQYELVHLLGDIDSDGDFCFGGDAHLSHEAMIKLLTTCSARLVVLATCESVPLGAFLASHMSVIAALRKVDTERIIDWEQSFYRFLGNGKTLAAAFDLSQAISGLPLVLMMRYDAVFIPSCATTGTG